MSMNLWLMLHRRRDIWVKNQADQSGTYETPDGRFHNLTNGPEFGFFQSFGNSTEGTEPTVPLERWTGNHTEEGCNEAYNYRLADLPKTIPISSQKFREELDKKNPIRLSAGVHVVALVGYDEIQKNFTYVDSANYADRTGYGTLTFADIDNKKAGPIGEITSAETWTIKPPKPVPTALIWIKHNVSRMNLTLWLSAEGSPHPAKKIWPAMEWPEENRLELNFKVRLPSELIWPPSISNRVVLDLYDSGITKGGDGGSVVEFKAAFGAHIIDCNDLNNGPITFKSGEHKRLYLPQ
jgi:hypothetical protein